MKSSRFGNSKKCNNTKFEGVKLQDEGALFTVRDLHHKDVTSTSNLGMTPKVVLHSLM
jgi:hypothetical protein